jgi:predicted Zn-dependent peptidase
MAATTPDADITGKQLESVRGYIAMLLNLERDDLDEQDEDDDGEDVQVVTEVTVTEVAKNTLPPKETARAILDQMDHKRGTGVKHLDGDTYEIEPRK